MALVNDLDLIMTYNGQTYYGNQWVDSDGNPVCNMVYVKIIAVFSAPFHLSGA